MRTSFVKGLYGATLGTSVGRGAKIVSADGAGSDRLMRTTVHRRVARYGRRWVESGGEKMLALKYLE